MQGHDIIVIGASAGGVEALIKLTRELPGNLPASLFIVLHIPAEGPDLLPSILNRACPLQVLQASDGMAIELGRIYTAAPDRHLLLEPGKIRTVRGPKENRHRPAVDPLFRSAALEYGPRVIGVVLTGSLDDGTAGMLTIQQRGGITIVQDPADALYPSMPENTMRYIQVDHCVPLAQIARLLIQLVEKPVADDQVYPLPPGLAHEVSIAKMDTHTLNGQAPEGQPSVFSCPECGGVLWEVQDGELAHFRCRVGHTFSTESIQSAQVEAFENALWVAYKTLQESTNFSRRMAEQAHERKQIWLAKSFEERALEAEKRANIIHDVLLKDLTGGTALDASVIEHEYPPS